MPFFFSFIRKKHEMIGQAKQTSSFSIVSKEDFISFPPILNLLHSTETREWLKTSLWLGEGVSTMSNTVAKHWSVVTVRMILQNLRKRSMNFLRVKIVFCGKFK